MDRLTACTSFTSTKMLLAKTRIIEMMLNTRMAFKPKKISAGIGRLFVVPLLVERKTHKHEEAASSVVVWYKF